MVQKFLVITSFFLLPVAFVAAQGQGTGPDASFGTIGNTIRNIIAIINNVVVPFLFAVAFLVFIYGIFRYFIYGGADEESRDKGKQLMIWGIIGFVLMVSLWGLVNVISKGLGFNQETISPGLIPNAPTQNN